MVQQRSNPTEQHSSPATYHKIEIWQLSTDTEEGLKARFLDYESNLRLNGRYRPELYEQVWSGTLQTDDLEEIYYIFNQAHPEDYHAPSLSVSDVVMIDGKHFFCDMIGFRAVDHQPVSLDSRIETAKAACSEHPTTKSRSRGEPPPPEH